MLEFIKEPALWTGLSLAIFAAVMVALKVPRALTTALDKRAERIRGDLDEARRLRDEAQSLLAGQRERESKAGAEANAIVIQARKEAERAIEEAKRNLADLIERRRKQAQDKIAQAEEQADHDIRAYAAQLSVGAARRFIGSRMDAERASALIDGAISSLPERLRGL